MRRGRMEWGALIKEFEASSETQVAFCKRKGLVVGSFRGWRYRLQREAAPEFVQVTFDEPRPTTIATLPNGVRIEFGPNTDPTYIGAVLGAC